ncbi:hypothetical protein OHV05_35240 (plasmid) [Kitasatospora sp. NBC_00070]|uniref:hypothetical protein n=1 Tax=Kitasatospora sp. NBC_00070 TaxID=2975962 RepID=UPI002F913273
MDPADWDAPVRWCRDRAAEFRLDSLDSGSVTDKDSLAGLQDAVADESGTTDPAGQLVWLFGEIIPRELTVQQITHAHGWTDRLWQGTHKGMILYTASGPRPDPDIAHWTADGVAAAAAAAAAAASIPDPPSAHAVGQHGGSGKRNRRYNPVRSCPHAPGWWMGSDTQDNRSWKYAQSLPSGKPPDDTGVWFALRQLSEDRRKYFAGPGKGDRGWVPVAASAGSRTGADAGTGRAMGEKEWVEELSRLIGM